MCLIITKFSIQKAHDNHACNVPFHKVLRSLVCEGMETVGGIDLSTNHVSLFLLRVIMSAIWVQNS